MKLSTLYTKLHDYSPRSAWNKGVKSYAEELLCNYDCDFDGINFCGTSIDRLRLLNGAKDWQQYSYGGCSLIYDEDIAKRLCTPSELKRTRNGERMPNSSETWIDVQARALYQACNLLCRLAKSE